MDQREDWIKERLQFIDFTQTSREALRRLKPLLANEIGTALKVFYEKVRATPAVRRFFKDEQHITGAQGRQERHWDVIANADFDDDYVRGVRAVGQVHARLGIEPRWYIGGYAVVLDQLSRAVLRQYWPRFLGRAASGGAEAAEALSSLIKAALLDMDFGVSTYLDALAEQRRESEAERAAAREQQTTIVRTLASALKRLAEGDLTVRIEEPMDGEFEAVKLDFNASLEKVQHALLTVSSTAEGIRAGTNDISAAADDLSRRTEQQAASLEETAASLQEITTNVNKAAEGAQHARQVVATAKLGAEASEKVVHQAIQAMSGIEASSKQIGRIIGVIDEIAFQTNLLALNAGVEAARAGEAGRGFAVVASEVRALAQRSAEAAKEIKGLISTSTGQVDQGVDRVKETGKALGQIVLQVTEINQIVAAIAASAQEQATGLRQVNTAVGQMDQVTQQNAAMVEETTAAARSLAAQTGELSQLIAHFHLGQKGQKAAATDQRAHRQASSSSLKGGASRAASAAARKAAPVQAAEAWEEF